MPPFAHVIRESDGNYAVIIHPPDDPDNFMVPHRTRNLEEADMLCGALNSIIESCMSWWDEQRSATGVKSDRE